MLSRPRALRTLVELSKSEPMTMRQFMEASGYVWQAADALRADLEEDGLIRVEKRVQGRVTHLQIWLEPQGKMIVELCLEILDAWETAKKTKTKAKPS